MFDSIPILYEDNHLLVINKPAGLATMGAIAGEPSVHSLMCQSLRQRYNKPGNVYLGVVQRLDALTSGVLVLARTSKAAARLNEQFRDASSATGDGAGASKSYLTVLLPDRDASLASAGTLVDFVAKNDRRHCMEVVSERHAGAQRAVLDYRPWDAAAVGLGGRVPANLIPLEVRLRTGRKHQIRVQFASRGCPVWGDVKYGGKAVQGHAIALHAWRLQIIHPTTKQAMVFTAAVPRIWETWFPELERFPSESPED